MNARLTILVVDDETNILKSVKRLFAESEYRILTAESAEEGLQLFEENEIQMVISDFRMPGISGVEFLSRIKETHPETIRIILSGYADVSAIVDAVNDGQIYKFISKPWNDQEFLTTIMRSFEQYTLRQENLELYGKLQNRNQELMELTESLEEKVISRTRDLEMKNRALKTAQSILTLLPVGVIGIDSEGMLVYMNDSLSQYINTDKLFLGAVASTGLDHDILDLMLTSEREQKPLSAEIGERKIGVIAIPLPERTGVIGLLGYFSNPEKLRQHCIRELQPQGVANV